ncbi:hypothetical protein NQ317_019151 [Molorchus minor]|uniref:Uncharacterized protein n=1 Tax=Molorchus minor TaxID=1323400 RepID=A0ABQ9JMX1_9CUCU|nr:hypothetical protein NQ317_019151 [Molorchus minor]
MLPEQDLDAKLTYTELTLGGFGFIPNLTDVDSSLIFPVALGVINLAIIELQVLSKINNPTKLQKIFTNVFRGFSVIMVPIATSVPSCLVLYWTTSSTYGLLQNLLLLSPRIKRICGIPKTATELQHPYKHIAEGLRNKLKSITGLIK